MTRRAASLLPLASLSILIILPTSVWPVSFQPVVPDELKMTGEPKAPGAPAIILFREVDRDDNRLTPHEDNYLRIKILTAEGRNYATVGILYEKEFENVVNIHARTIKPNGSIVEFDGKVYDKTAKHRGEENSFKVFTLPDVEVGAIIEYYYTIDLREYYVYQSHWILSHELFTRDAKFSLKPYKNVYTDFHLRWTWQSLPGGAEPKEGIGGIVQMEAHDIPAFQQEDFMPPENELKARVDFVYDQEIPEREPDKFWRNVGKKRNGALESFIGKRTIMHEAVSQIVSPNDAPEVKLRKIYDRVQQIRNTSYEIRKTEQEEKRDKEKPEENVEDIWKRGYGNGQHLTWLYLALVRGAGIEAYGCWVADRRQYFFNPKLMKSGELDANVVLVRLNGKDLYFDPGGAFTPFGMLEWSETGVSGLRLDKDGGSWIQTTLPQASESQIRREAKLKLSEAGDLEGEVTVTYTGLEAMYHRRRERHEDETSRKKYLEDSLKGQIPAAAEVELTSKPDWGGAETPLVAVLNLKIPDWASSAGKRAILPVGFFSAYEKHVFEHANRVHPIYFNYPYEKLDDVRIELPLGWQISSLPQPRAKDAKAVVYSLSVENSGGMVHVVRKLDVDLMILDVKYYPALQNFFQLVRTGDEEQVLLQPASASASN
jgi:transglutaminase-like putative cysteine protease